MGASAPRRVFAHKRTVRLIIDDDMRIDSLEVIASLPEYQADITGVVPLFGGKCIDITLRDHAVAARLAESGFDYGDIRKPLRLLGEKAVHVSCFVPVEFPDNVVLELLKQYGELKTENLRRLYFQEEGFSHIERGIRVAEFTRINRDLPRRIVTQGVEINFKYTEQPITCYRCNSTEHVVRNCDKQCCQEGGAVSRVNIGSLITASVTSRHTSVIFKMAGKFLVRYVAKDVNFLNVWIHLLPSSIRRSF